MRGGAFFSGLYFSTIPPAGGRQPISTRCNCMKTTRAGRQLRVHGARMKGDPKEAARLGSERRDDRADRHPARQGSAGFRGHVERGLHRARNGTENPSRPAIRLCQRRRDADDDETGTFQYLFPTNHLDDGYMDLFAWQNLHNPSLRFSVERSRQLKLMLDYHAFWLASTGDAGIAPIKRCRWRPSRQVPAVMRE